jgi:hypothetical protein
MKLENKSNVIPIRKNIEQIDNLKKTVTIEESFDEMTKFLEELTKEFNSRKTKS